MPVIQTVTEIWTESGKDTPTVLAVQNRAPDGTLSWTESHGRETIQQWIDSDPSDGDWIQLSIAADGTAVEQIFTDGRLSSVRQLDSLGALLHERTQTYDPHGRVGTITDSRTGTTEMTYYDNDAAASVIAPDPDGAGPLGLLETSYEYDTMGRPTKIVHPDDSETLTEYTHTGQEKKTYGAQQNPLKYKKQLIIKWGASPCRFTATSIMNSVNA